MINLSLGYPDFNSELELARSTGSASRTELVSPVISTDILIEMQNDIHDVYINDEVYKYLLNLIVSTRNHPYIERGASPRATIALVRMAKASAWLRGRNFVVPSDVQSQLPYVLSHRIITNSSAKLGSVAKMDIIRSIVQTVDLPYMGVRS